MFLVQPGWIYQQHVIILFPTQKQMAREESKLVLLPALSVPPALLTAHYVKSTDIYQRTQMEQQKPASPRIKRGLTGQLKEVFL